MAFRFAAQSAFRPIARTVKAPVRRMGNDAPWPEQSAIIQKLEATPASVLIVGANIGAAAISLTLCIIYNMTKNVPHTIANPLWDEACSEYRKFQQMDPIGATK